MTTEELAKKIATDIGRSVLARGGTEDDVRAEVASLHDALVAYAESLRERLSNLPAER